MFQWVQNGLRHITITGGEFLDASLAAAGNELALVTTDPFTYDYNAVTGDYTYSADAGLSPQAMSLLTLLGPFNDDSVPDHYYKLVGVIWENQEADPKTITGISFQKTAGPVLYGVVIFDDPVVLPPGGTITVDIPIGVATGNPDASIEVLLP